MCVGGVRVVCGSVVCGDGRVGRMQLLMSVLSGLHLDRLCSRLWDSVRFCVCRRNDVHCMHRSVCLWDAKEKACLRHRALPPCYRSLKVFERWSRSVSLLALSGQCTDILLLHSSTLAVSHAPWQGGASGRISCLQLQSSRHFRYHLHSIPDCIRTQVRPRPQLGRPRLLPAQRGAQGRPPCRDS